MKISSQIAWEFDRQSVATGYRIYSSGGVTAEIEHDGSVSAKVDGYRPVLRIRGSKFEAKCNCAAFKATGHCSHVWAALLYAENLDLLSDIPSSRVQMDRPKPAPAPPPASRRGRVHVPRATPPKPKMLWKGRVDNLLLSVGRSAPSHDWPPNRIIVYAIQAYAHVGLDLRLHVYYSDPKKNGKGFTKPRSFNLMYYEFALIPDDADRAILQLLAGARESNYYSTDTPVSTWSLYPEFARQILPQICATGRCLIDKEGVQDPPLLRWNPEPWRFSLTAGRHDERHFISGEFTRGDQKMPVSTPLFMVADSLLFTEDEVSPINCDVHFEWINNLRVQGPIYSPPDEWQTLVGAVAEARLPAAVLPDELRIEEISVEPTPCLRIETRNTYYRAQEDVALLSFDYAGNIIPAHDHRNGFLQPGNKLLVRDREAERRALTRLADFRLGQSTYVYDHSAGWSVPPDKLGKIVFQLTKEGWRIDFKGKQVMQPTETVLDITSGIDWFDLKATVTYGKHKYTYPQLLRALEMGGPALILPDGEIGVLPDEWIAEVGRLASLGRRQGDGFRFGLNQAGILDVLLTDRPEARFDEAFIQARDRLKAFDGVHAVDQPAGFNGQLREYQREGLGWMQFLREFGFGGCLADDMGVGKTAQVLAMLETRRGSPSIAVVPRSLVFNWKQEAARFTPSLRILDHTTPTRNLDQIKDHDLVIVTYGTLRRDIVKLREIPFDYAVLDEAQAVKNAGSDSAKAARLLNARHRLALSGTPVQNSLSDLWSLFEFLNPGMLGASSAFKAAGGSPRNPEEETRVLLARALRPLILRRTKEQVASELPPKIESILHCELEDEQRKLYDELREHYRQTLLGAIDSDGMGKAKIMVLEALLRLRQAACHPGLIDKKRTGEPSAKLDTLLARLAELSAEGHKALVFSQFTSFLDIVRQRLDEEAIRYEYLDGATRDRQARVQGFEQDSDCKLFLISLKAGGVGLNLVSADYVFLLDPWWNPAVEAQAIDRTHRIGQTRHVFAYRLIARDTVEEKVLALQDSKRILADAVINQDNSLLSQMGREELEYLLS